MKNLKKILVLVLCFALVLTFAACGGSSNDGGDDEQEVYTLRFAHGSSESEPIHKAAESSLRLRVMEESSLNFIPALPLLIRFLLAK